LSSVAKLSPAAGSLHQVFFLYDCGPPPGPADVPPRQPLERRTDGASEPARSEEEDPFVRIVVPKRRPKQLSRGRAPDGLAGGRYGPLAPDSAAALIAPGWSQAPTAKAPLSHSVRPRRVASSWRLPLPAKRPANAGSRDRLSATTSSPDYLPQVASVRPPCISALRSNRDLQQLLDEVVPASHNPNHQALLPGERLSLSPIYAKTRR
jgi:hypothetical protein